MSGIEVVGLIIPFIIEGIKAYKGAYEKVHTFRHYSKEVERVQSKIYIQKQFFLNECEFLLRLVLQDGRDAKRMIRDPQHKLWRDESLDKRLYKCLDDNYHGCMSLIEEVLALLEGMEVALRCFDEVVTQKGKDESIKQTFRRLRKSLKIAFEKSHYEKTIKDLRQYNEDLSQLRLYISDFQNGSRCHMGNCMSRRPLVPEYTSIQKASRTLHDCMIAAWGCREQDHDQHFAKLCIDVTFDHCVRLDLAVAHSRRYQATSQGVIVDRPVWLSVQSISLKSYTGLPTPDRSPSALLTNGIKRALNSPSPPPTIAVLPAQAVNSTSSLSNHPTRKKKKVRFQDSTAEVTSPAPQDEHRSIFNLDGALNLCQMGNVCKHFKSCCLSKTTIADRCLGYLESPDMYKHIFWYSTSRQSIGATTNMTMDLRTSSLSELIANLKDDTLDVVSQLKIAKKLVVAVLQFHATPWLKDSWDMQHLSYFGTPDKLTEDVLRTLHLSIQFPESNSNNDTLMDDVEVTAPPPPKDNFETERLQYGINNMPLFSLGAALLEIGRWESLQNVAAQFPNDIVAVRKLSGRRTRLGDRYQTLIQKCLQCNFGFGTDLTSPALQNAVHDNIVGELENMIASLDIGGR